MPKEPKSAVAARKSSDSVRPVVCERGRGDVGADVLRRDQLGGPPLDVLAGQGVGHVGGPEALDALDHAEVDPAAAGRARLPVDAGVGRAQVVEQPVEARASAGAPPPRRRGGAAGLEQVAVVVPLDRVDGVGGEHGADLVEDVLAHLVAGEVEDQLVTVQQRHPVAGGEDPVGVVAVEVGVGVDHLRLEPEPELHAEPAHVVDQRRRGPRATRRDRPASRRGRRCRRGGP